MKSVNLFKQMKDKKRIKKVFGDMKKSNNIITEQIVLNEIDIAKKELENAELINQEQVVAKLHNLLEIKGKEVISIKKGFNKFIDKSVIDRLITNDIGGRNLALINLKDYPRPIPIENAKTISEAQKLELYDEIIILHTDYSDETENVIKEKDPIAFGVFNLNKIGLLKNPSDRLYVITDWIDEYCDMNLERMISELGLIGENTSTLEE